MTSTPIHQSTRTASIGAALDLTERFPVAPTRNIRRPKTLKHEPRLTDGLTHPVVTRRLVIPTVEAPVFTHTAETRNRATKYVMYALEAEFEGDDSAALSWMHMARLTLDGSTSYLATYAS